jgi:aminoglycoside phosphotransferase (APT) family kinase protein
MADDEFGAGIRPQTGARDREDLKHRLEAWLNGRLSAGARPRITSFDVPASNGLSSETVLFDAEWLHEGDEHTEELVARLAPDRHAMPVFPSYDLERQARVMRIVRDTTTLPVPNVRWWEPDAAALGAQFFVMDRIAGQVPPDLMPYNMIGWLVEASAEQRAALQHATIAVLAALFDIEAPEKRFEFLAGSGEEPSFLRRHLLEQQAYYEWVADGRPIPLVERMFTWLHDRWPAHEGPTVLSWGDARIGNIMYRDFEVVGVFDWEMAALGPPELDLGWMVYIHRYFEHVARQYGMPGLPDLLRLDDVASEFEHVTGYAPRSLDFALMYAALRHAVIMVRLQRRAIHFGEAVMPDDPDDLVMHRLLVEEMLAT